MGDEKSDTRSFEPLVHPVYLDVPVMVSFLAAVECGVAYEDESTEAKGWHDRPNPHRGVSSSG